MSSGFVHCHVHSEHSILDGSARVKDIPFIAKEHGDEAVCLSDHGTLGAALKFWKAGKEAEIKTIQAVETYVTPDMSVKTKDSPTWHLVLLAMNKTGLDNLCAMSRIGWTTGFYKKPRVDYATLNKYSDGIIALSACMASEISRAMEQPDGSYEVTTEAEEALLRYKGIYKDRFYAELQPGNPVDLNQCVTELAVKHGVYQTVTVDSHYDHCASKATEELVLIMQQLSSLKPSVREYAHVMAEEARREKTMLDRLNKLWPDRRLNFSHLELYLMTRDEVTSRMDKQGFNGNTLADNTLMIGDRCEQIEFKTGVNYLPKIDKRIESDDYLETLVQYGLEERGLDKDEKYQARVREELDVIKSKGFSTYFLIVWDVINEARRRNIYVGPGRGSAAGSLVAYALKITNIDPIKKKLLFFRFMSGIEVEYNPVFTKVHE